jgi:DNA-3-methyladenine glycosylase II
VSNGHERGTTGCVASLTPRRLAEAAQWLAERDPGLAGIYQRHGAPPMWSRKPGFVTLARIILEQQVSLASANALYRRLVAALDPLSPETVLLAGEAALRGLGLTRQKASYLVNLAREIDRGCLDLSRLATLDDQQAIGVLVSVKGVGPWSARVYLLMALRRPDVWPSGDIALAAAVASLRGLEKRPGTEQLADMAMAWQPHRATAARMLWQYYLTGMKKGG